MTRFLIFFGVVLLVLGGLHYYTWARLVRDTGLAGTWRRVGTISIIALGVLTPATLIMGRFLSPGVARVVSWPGYVWLGMLFLIFLGLVGTDFGRAVAWIARKASGAPSDPERRLFFARAIGAGVMTAVGGATVWGIREAFRPRVKTVEVPIAKLPPQLDGLSIAQLTDIHIGPTLGRGFLQELVDRTNAAKPDVIAITGDLVDGSVEALRDSIAPLAALRAPHGVYFVTGNHEYYSGAASWVAHLATLGIRVLRNERVPIAGGALDLAGVDDLHSRGMAPGHGHDLPAALAGRDPNVPVVLLAHQPKSVLEASKLGVDLQLSGHTHGGQIWPWRYMVFLQQPYVEGLHDHAGTKLYVSRGCGYWGPPMRIHAPPEIARVVLRARSQG